MQFTVRWFGRPLADAMTPLFYNGGWSADGLTYFRAGLGAWAVAILISPDYRAAVLGCTLFYLCFVLDCVDGNLARLHNSASYWGKFIDGLVDFIFILGAPSAVGISLFLSGEDVLWLAVGVGTSVASLCSQMVRSRLSFIREWMINQSGPIDKAALNRGEVIARVQRWVAEIYVNGTFFAPIVLLAPDSGRKAYLAMLLVVQFATELVWLVSTLAQGRIILARGRRSIHAAVDGTGGKPPLE